MTVEEMEDFLKGIGIETYGVRGSEIKALCPGHLDRTGKEDHNPSWSINADTGAHNCFSCGFRGGLQFLVSYVNGIPYEEANEWVKTTTSDLSARLERALAPKVKVVEDSINLTEANLAAYTLPPFEILKQRGITIDSAVKYEILYDSRKDCWILPIRDVKGKLLGWQEKGVRGRYFMNYPTGIKKSQSLFGYSQYKGGNMIVVESPLDVARMDSVGVSGGVATYGTSVSKDQINMIKGADRIIFAMDNDDAGRTTSSDLLQRSVEMWFECWFFDYTGIDCKDVGGMSKAEIIQGIQGSKHSLHGEGALA
jgi:DNA primase